MSGTIAIIMPAYRADATIVEAAQSVLQQGYPKWQLVVISDDGTDYEAVLGRGGLRDNRFRFLSSKAPKSGASRARNVGLDWIETDYAAILDADDRFKPGKLKRFADALTTHPIVSCALDVVDQRFTHLRHVGRCADRELGPGTHKWVNFSMDSMIAWDRRRTDARYDPALPNMTDLDFLMKLYRTVPNSFHIGEPLHEYVKLPVSMSNGPGVTERMIAAKRLIIAGLDAGQYPFAEPTDAEGLRAFLEISIAAEAEYGLRVAADPSLLFEDHIEPMLRAAR